MATHAPARDQRPNVVFILADDCTYSDLGPWGGTNVPTPNVDRLAASGLTFDRAHVSMPICAPTRAAFYTGQYPATNGLAWNHGFSRPGTRSMPHHLGDLGYRVGIAGKVHVQPHGAYPFDAIDGVEGNCVSETADFDLADAEAYITRDTEQPFAIVFGLVVPHVPWTVGDRDASDPATLKLPPILADCPEVREAYRHYLAEVGELDRQVGEILNLLDRTGVADNTLVVFSSEQGAQMPGAKWNLWDVGTHTGLIARWPGVTTPGTRTDALAMDVDLMPTLIEAAGGDVEAGGFDGVSFAPLLRGDSGQRELIFTSHNHVPDGPSYPMRSVTDGRWHYVRNLRPDRAYLVKFTQGNDGRDSGLWKGMLYAAAFDDHAADLINRVLIRPAEHLYDLASDPAEMRDLAGDPRHAAELERLSAALDDWMKQTGDPGAEADSAAAWRANRPAD